MLEIRSGGSLVQHAVFRSFSNEICQLTSENLAVCATGVETTMNHQTHIHLIKNAAVSKVQSVTLGALLALVVSLIRLTVRATEDFALEQVLFFAALVIGSIVYTGMRKAAVTQILATPSEFTSLERDGRQIRLYLQPGELLQFEVIPNLILNSADASEVVAAIGKIAPHLHIERECLTSERASAPPQTRLKQSIGGFLISGFSAAMIWFTWNHAIENGEFSVKASILFPVFAVLGVAMMLFKFPKDERLARGEDISSLAGWRILTTPWRIASVAAILAPLLNYYLLVMPR
jgi:hypothetical protein